MSTDTSGNICQLSPRVTSIRLTIALGDTFASLLFMAAEKHARCAVHGHFYTQVRYYGAFPVVVARFN